MSLSDLLHSAARTNSLNRSVLVWLQSAALVDRREQFSFHRVCVGIVRGENELELGGFRLGHLAFGHGRVDTDAVAHGVAVRFVTKARLARNEVQVALLVLVVKSAVDRPEHLDLLILGLAIHVNRILLQTLDTLAIILLVHVHVLFGLSEIHQIVPVEVVAQVIKVTERLLDTDLDVLHLLLVLSDQPIEELVTELLVVLRVDWLNSNQLLLRLVRERSLRLLAIDGQDLVVAGRPEEALVVRPDTVLLCLLEFVEAFTEARILFGEVLKSGQLTVLHEHPEGGSHRHSEPQVIFDHGAANERSNHLEALHPLWVCHCGVQSVAVTLRTSLVSAIGHLDEQWELVSHEFPLNLTESEGGSVVFFFIT